MVVWTWWRLFRALRQAVAGIDIDITLSAYGKTVVDGATRPRSGSEAFLHEIFHALLLGLKPMGSRELADVIRELRRHPQDEYELSSLAAELVFAERVGLVFNVKPLVAFAVGNLQRPWDERQACLHVEQLRGTPEVLKVVDEALDMIGVRYQ